ncbi:MAG: type VI secretion system contractile sheath large subunit [Sulfurovum sp.]|nr:type VI secretion system contractile sheath large subunit [Sulfurovum sp.]
MNKSSKTSKETLTDNSPLLDNIISQTKLTQDDEGYQAVKTGVSALIKQMLSSDDTEVVNKDVVNSMIAEIDRKMSAQMDVILHNESFQQLESRWRGLYTLVSQTDFRQNITIDLLNVTKHQLQDDFEENPDITQTGLYKHVYTSGYGQFGGKTVGAMIADYEFSPGNADIKFLHKAAAVAAMAHAPFITAANERFFGVNTFEDLPNLKDMEDLHSGPQFAAWRGLRENEDSRYLGLTLPRFLLRPPYDPEDNAIKTFNYKETIDGKHTNYLWGNTAYAFATRLTESFANYRWCTNIIGPKGGGAVKNLPVHTFKSMGDLEMKIPTEVLISDRKEYEISELGFIPLTMRKDSDNAAFFAANSVQVPKKFPNTPEGNKAEMNYRLGTQLPYLFAATRMAHYIKVIQREYIGSWRERSDLETELNNWIRQYVADQESPPSGVRSRRPFRGAKIAVTDVANNPGWYGVKIDLRPHFKYMGADFELSLVGKLDKE